jgi:hypothetical protein
VKPRKINPTRLILLAAIFVELGLPAFLMRLLTMQRFNPPQSSGQTWHFPDPILLGAALFFAYGAILGCTLSFLIPKPRRAIGFFLSTAVPTLLLLLPACISMVPRTVIRACYSQVLQLRANERERERARENERERKRTKENERER